jgi:hypothetical protein
VNVTVPEAELVAPESADEIEPAATAAPVVAVAGAPIDTPVAFDTTVAAWAPPQALAMGLLLASPL